MKINILYLYYDLMNLNGEHANVLSLKKHFEYQDVLVKIDYKTINDEIEFNKYDIVYMGQGSDDNQILVLNDMLTKKNDIIEAIENNVYFFLTGNSLELFGKSITDLKGNNQMCLGIFDYYVKYIDIENYSDECKYRVVEDVTAMSKFIDQKIIGFQNRAGLIYDNDSALFTMLTGTGNNTTDKNEGFSYKNFYATYIIGPLFIRNPYLTDYFVNKIIKEKDKSYKIKNIKLTEDYKAYKQFFINFPNK